MQRTRALIVGADSAIRQALAQFLAGREIDAWEAEGAERGLALARRRPADVALVCADVAGADEARFIRDIRTFDERTQVIAIVGSAERGRAALAAGAYDYFLEPIDLARLDVVLRHMGEAAAAREQSELLAQQCAGAARLGPLVTQDPRLIGVFTAARRLARYETPVLIVGEAGTGKESLARALHALGRPDKPFVAVEGAALTPEAVERSWAAAQGGTLFVTDAHTLGPEAAAVLVTMLDRGGEVRMIGGGPAVSRRSSSTGTPYEDLMLRFAETVLEVPALGARPGDVVPIAREILRRRSGEREPPALAGAVGEALRAHDWPGNVDELCTVLDAALAAAGGQAIAAPHLPPPLRAAAPPATAIESRKLADIEAAHLRQVLAETRGNKAHAARILGVSRWALQRKLQKHGVATE